MRILIAGGTGYLGKYMIKACHKAGHTVLAIGRNREKLEVLSPYIHQIIVDDLSDEKRLSQYMKGVDVVFTSVGITRQKDGLTYKEVDYGYNKKLLDAALVAKVDKFVYTAALNGDKLLHLKIMQAKEAFVQLLETAPIKSYIIRPSGFFSDIEEVYKMAMAGQGYVFGKGCYKANPIHGEDLSNYIVEKIDEAPGTYEVGGPQVLTQVELYEIAFKVVGTPVRVRKIPQMLLAFSIGLLKLFTKVSTYGPLEFFAAVLTQDMYAPPYGSKTVEAHFRVLHAAGQ